MFLYFTTLSCSERFKINYDIVPPIKTTKIGDYNIWSLAGSANNMKNSFHLSSRVNKSHGAVCARLPTSAPKWSANLNLTVGIGSFNFMFTQDVCPFRQYKNGAYWRGFTLNFDEFDEQLNVSMIHVKNDYSYSWHNLCTIPTSNTKVNITVENNTVALKYANEKGEYVECGDPKVYPYLVVGFITMSSQPYVKIGSSDIFEFKMELPEDHFEEFDKTVLEKIARKAISPKNKTTKPMSIAERITYSIPDESNNENTFKYIDAVLGEMNKSISNALSSKDLNALIEGKVRKSLAVIEKKITKRKNMLGGISDSLKIVKRSMDNDLSTLKSNMYVSMEEVKRYSISELKKFLVKAQEANQTLPNAANESAKTVQEMWTPAILYIIAIIELLCYVIFFLHKRKVTDNFKKYD